MNTYRFAWTACFVAFFTACLHSGIVKADSPATTQSDNGASGKAVPATSAPSKLSPTTAPSAAAAHPATRDSGDLTDLSLEDLMNVQVISVSKKRESIADAPAAVTVIDQDMIARSGFSTIPDLLRLAPGMDVARINSQTWAISSRGRNDTYADDLLVLQDGRSLYSPMDSGVHWNSVDYILQDLDRIEVINGPGATLWGSNAVNGVINITSKDSRDTQGWLVSGLGSNDDSNLAVRYGGMISSDTSYRVYFKEKYDQGLPGDAETPASVAGADSWYSQRGGFRIDKHPDDSDSFTLQGDLGNNQLRIPDGVPILVSPYERNSVFDGDDTTGNVLGRWNHKVNDESDFSVQAYYDYFKNYTGTYSDTTNTFDIDFHNRFMVGMRNEVVWGAGYRFYRTETPTEQFVYWTPSEQNRNLFNVFAQDTLKIVPDRLSLTVGSKLEHNDFTGFELEPSGRLLWTPDDRNSIWGSVSRATRSPATINTAINLTTAVVPVPVGGGVTVPADEVLRGKPNFVSEKEVAYELGYRCEVTKSFSVDVRAFYNNYTHALTVDTGTIRAGNPLVIPVTFGNGGQEDSYGGEISGNLRVSENWRLSASYSLLHSTDYLSRGSRGIVYPVGFAQSAPQHQAQVHSYLDITKNLQFNAAVYFTSSVGEFNVPAFWSADLNLKWEPVEGLEMSVGVINLFDTQHPEFGTTAGQGIADQIPRTVYAQLTYRF
jgi:iron complex outermembrane receptor protein